MYPTTTRRGLHQYYIQNAKFTYQQNTYLKGIPPGAMNFNRSGQSQSPPAAQQQQYDQRQKMSMLPPQFQNLTPQQLQELKKQPQFQNMLRQYFQRQQLMQQQAMQGMNLAREGTQGGTGTMNANMATNINTQNASANAMNPGMAAAGMPMGAAGMNSAMNPAINPGMGASLGLAMNPAMGSGVNPNVNMAQAVQPPMSQNLGQANQMSHPQTAPNMGSSINQNILMNMALTANRNLGLRVPMQQNNMGQPMYSRAAQNAYLQQQQKLLRPMQQPAGYAPYVARQDMDKALAMGMPGVSGASLVGAGVAGPGAAGAGAVSGALAGVGGPLAGAVNATAAGAAVPAQSSALTGPINGINGAMGGQIHGPANGAASATNGAASGTSGGNRLIKEKPQIAPGFTPEAVARVPMKTLRSASEWSDRLREAGKDVPLDVRVYEDIIRKDELFLRLSAYEAQKHKAMLEKMALDIKTYGMIKQLRMNAISALAKNQYNNSIWGEGYQGYGNGASNTATQVILPRQNKTFTKVPDLPSTDREMNARLLQNASKPAQVVPVRLDFDQERDRFKLRDTFLWNLNDDTYPLEHFVRTLLEDYKFISEQHMHTVLASVSEQIKDFRKIPEKTMGEIRVPIKIDLIINNTQYVDQFEWDILNSRDGDPEEFATILCDEMSLPGEFATAIAFSIREQSQLYHKALFLVGYSFDGSAIREEEIRSHILPALRVLNSDDASGPVEDFISTLRNPGIVADYSPSLNKLTQLEVEKVDKEMERESRRRRRHFNTENTFSYNENGPNLFSSGSGRGTTSRRNALHSGRGVKTTLPDLGDIPKTFRTPMPSSVLPGGIDLGVPDIYGYNELIVNRTQVKNPDYKQPAPPGMVTSYRDSTGSFYVKILLRRGRN